MAKWYPFTPSSSPSFSSSSPSSSFSSSSLSSSPLPNEREVFTIWMKSLVINGNGYTIYDSNGKVVYRIDNYGSKCCSEVYLMDLQGNVLCTILRKKFLQPGLWDGYKSNEVKEEKPWFHVRKGSRFLDRDSAFHVNVISDEARFPSYKIQGSVGGFSFKITDNDGRIVAEVKQKQLSSGNVLGEDVLSLTIEPLVDHSFIMALVAVYALIHHKM